MADQLYRGRSYDPLSILIAVVVLSLAAALAGFIPPRRAASIEPMEALRIELRKLMGSTRLLLASGMC